MKKQIKTGFTLIELLVVMVIIGILATISTATFGGNQEKAREAKITAECSQIERCSIATTACQENGGTNCDGFCDLSTFDTDPADCPGGSIALTPTDESCFTFGSGTISGYAPGGVCTSDVVIPSTISGTPVVSVGGSAFQGDGLTSVYFPSSITSLGANSFRDNNLTTVSLPDGVELAAAVFAFNDISTLTLPDTFTPVGSYDIGDFMFHGNTLTSVSMKTGTTYRNNAFPNCTVSNNCITFRP